MSSERDHVLDACRGLPVAAFAAGDDVLREGERTGRLYVLAEGQVAVLKRGVEVARADMPGALFGEMSVLLDLPHSATVRALSATRLHVVEEGGAFLAGAPGVAFQSARLLAQRLHDATAYLADLKAQYEGAVGQFGMIDRVLDSLMNQPRDAQTQAAPLRDDPRL